VNASTITVQSAPPTSHLTRQRQIQAVEHLWQVVRNLSSEFSNVIFVDSVVTSQELDGYFRKRENAHFLNCLREYADVDLSLRKFASAGASDAAKEKPFVTNRLWSVFIVLQAIYGRTALLLTNSYKEGRYVNWRMDSVCDQLLRAILPAHTVEHAKAQEINGLRTTIDNLESRFHAEAGMNKLSA
jgi:hypothetical protein